MKMKTKCQECGGSDLQWHSSVTNKSDVVDGRLRTHDLDVLFYVGCNDCSATVQRATGDQIARHLNEAVAQAASAAPAADACDTDLLLWLRRNADVHFSLNYERVEISFAAPEGLAGFNTIDEAIAAAQTEAKGTA